ncbi:MAG: hypothetical protein IJT87_10225 [Ruminiclostridium sp.]|nr:hypothetical protein [Ruminiclostridium sp.]
MTETVLLIVSAFIIARLYGRTERPKLYAFLGATCGVLTLIGGELLLHRGLSGINICNSALAVLLGIPGTLLHLLLPVI